MEKPKREMKPEDVRPQEDQFLANYRHAISDMMQRDSVEYIRNIHRPNTLQMKQFQTVKAKVHLEMECSNGILSRSELESLSRALHHLTTLKEENVRRAREEKRRIKTTSRFQIKLNKIQAQVEQNKIHSTKLQQENIELGEKLKELTKECKLRNEQIDRDATHKELQQQPVENKLHQTKKLIKEADKKHQRESAYLLKEAMESRHKYEEMKHQEAQLKEQMTMKIKEPEEEMIVGCTKQKSSHEILLQVAKEKTIWNKEYKASEMKLKQLDELFTALEVERNKLSETVEVLKKQLSGKAKGVNSAKPVKQPCPTPGSLKESGTPLKEGQESTRRLRPRD